MEVRLYTEVDTKKKNYLKLLEGINQEDVLILFGKMLTVKHIGVM